VRFGRRSSVPARLARLEVKGRRSGATVAFSVVVADYGGGRYLVSMLGEGTNWVRNVRAADGRAVLRHGHAETVRLVEVAAADRAPDPAAIPRMCPWRPHPHPDRPQLGSGSLRNSRRRYPVFAITPG
jgi:hypothetical protein